MMRLTQGLHRSRHLFGERVATVYYDRTRSWAEVADRVARLAAGLEALGANPGDRIAILAHNSDHYLEAYYAIAWCGCVAVPFNTRWAIAELTHAIEDSKPSIILVGGSFSGCIDDFTRAGLLVIQMDGPSAFGAISSFAGLIEANGPIVDRCGSNTDLAAIFYTGGTTGKSKGVMLSHENLIINFLMQQAVAPYPADTRFLHSPPMFHLADAGCLLGLTMLGATHVILPGFHTEAVIEAIERDGVNALVLVPTMIGMLCEELSARQLTLDNIRRVTYGASSISKTTLARAMQALPNAEFCQGYGQTELSPVATILTHEDHLAGHLSSAGRPPPLCDLRIVDEDFREMPVGSVGEVAVRGPGVMQGYWNLPELTSHTIREGWLRTGDAGRVDEEGYLYLVDRVKDMIVSGGENVYSAEVENALLSHPDVMQCAVIGIPDSIWGESVHAVVQLRNGSTASIAELLAHCEPLIARYKHPKSFDLRDDPLPLSGVGKILKTELRAPFWQGIDRRIS